MRQLAIKIGDSPIIGLSTPPIGCVLDLPGLPGGGNKIYDRSPYGNIGTITGAVWKRLPSGLWCLDFDGEDDDVNCGDDSSLDFGTGDFTISLWVKADVLAVNYELVGKRQADSELWVFRFSSAKLRFVAVVGGVVKLDAVTADASPFSTDTWYKITYTVDRDGSQYIRVNGVAQTLDTDIQNGEGVTISPTGDLLLGEVNEDNYFNGCIALPRIYNRALSALEIQNHYRQEKHLFGV